MNAGILFPRMIRHNGSRFFMFHQKNYQNFILPE